MTINGYNYYSLIATKKKVWDILDEFQMIRFIMMVELDKKEDFIDNLAIIYISIDVT